MQSEAPVQKRRSIHLQSRSNRTLFSVSGGSERHRHTAVSMSCLSFTLRLWCGIWHIRGRWSWKIICSSVVLNAKWWFQKSTVTECLSENCSCCFSRSSEKQTICRYKNYIVNSLRTLKKFKSPYNANFTLPMHHAASQPVKSKHLRRHSASMMQC